MADSGIRHVVSTVPVPRTEFEDEEFHALIHGITFPVAPTERQLYYRDDTHKWYIYNDTVWKECTGGDADVAAHAALKTGIHGVGARFVAETSVEDLDLAAHAARHQNGGADEINVVGLSGELADNQPPKAHKASHENGGADKISVAGLSGLLADGQTPLAHDLGGAKHNADTLANLNAKVNDATLDDSGDPRDPNAHAASHENGGDDEISLAALDGEPSTLTTHKDLTTGVHALDKSCSVINSADQTIADSTWTALTWDTEQWDTDAIHDLVTNPERLTCKTAGKYLILLYAFYNTDATGFRCHLIQKNGVNIMSTSNDGVTGKETFMYVVFFANLSVDDYLNALTYQNSGGNLNIDKESFFQMARIA